MPDAQRWPQHSHAQQQDVEHATRGHESFLITEVTRNDTPMVVPTRPFALSLRSSEIKRVTSVMSAIDRIFPAITPSIDNTMKTHNITLAGLVNVCSGVS
jgi:hypothetical protein